MANAQNPSRLRTDEVMKVYLITYSHANTDIFNRQSFADAVVKAFGEITTTQVIQWACSIENHKEGGVHFHMCVLLNKLQRWNKVKIHLHNQLKIVVNFSGHLGYDTAYNYCIKEDGNFVTSGNHPERVSAPKTGKATKAKNRKAMKKRLSNLQVSNVILKNRIHSRVHLLAYAKAQSSKGDTSLYEFILNKGTKKCHELLEAVWEMEGAKEKIDRASLSRLQILKQQLQQNCVCEGEWLHCAQEILEKNGIEKPVFCDAIVKLLVMGRGKGRNIFISGPANCGKTFILDPLRVVFQTFLSPATCSYAWLGVEDKEVIFLNDFRYSPVILPWSDMLLLLEGHAVHFAAPKTSYSKDILFEADTPIFATSKAPITFIKGSVLDHRETEMMNVRWRMFECRHQIDLDSQKSVPSCGCCFSKFLLQ